MATRVTIDKHRITRVNGRPLFLIGARHMPRGGTPEILRDAGFNAFRQLAFGTESAEAQAVPRHLEGIFFWSYIFDRADFDRSPGYERELREVVRCLRAHPALLCYENCNEPTLCDADGKFKCEPESLARGTRLLRELDPDHPIWLAHTCGNTVETLRRFGPCADIVGCNPYPVDAPGPVRTRVRGDGRRFDCPDPSVHAVGRYTEKMMAVGEGKKPVWMLLQAMANARWHVANPGGRELDESELTYPTHRQMRFMAFDAIIAGATGLSFSMYQERVGSAFWKDVTRVTAELRRLHDVLASPRTPGIVEITYTDLGFTIWDGVRTLVRRRGGEVFLLAANTAFDPARTKIRLDLSTGLSALVEGEEREVPVQDGCIEDDFDPYGVHVYRLKAG